MVKRLSELKFHAGADDGCHGMFVKDTPHYKYVLGDQGPYISWQQSRGKNVFEKTQKFNILIESVKKKGVKHRIEVMGNMIIDGHHRAAIALARGDKDIECRER